MGKVMKKFGNVEKCLKDKIGLMGWCVKRETMGFLRIRGERKSCYGTCFFSIPLFGPLVLQLLTEFLLVFYNSIGLRFAFQKFESVGVFLCI